MHQGDAEILERIEAGERAFRPGFGVESRATFEALVSQLRRLKERGLIDMPDPSVAPADEQAGAYLLVGPCALTDAGREALRELRGERRAAERRLGERRFPGAVLPQSEAERRRDERRSTDRRHGEPER